MIDDQSVVIGAVVGSLGGLIVVGGIAALLVLWHKKNQKERAAEATAMAAYEASRKPTPNGDESGAHEYAESVPAVVVPTASSSGKYNDAPDDDKIYHSADEASSDGAPPMSTLAAKQSWKIDAGDLTLGYVLGQGAFGVVKQGIWAGKDVAVKQINKEGLNNAKAVRDFETEIERMATMRPHPNVVIFYGVTTLANGDLCAVIEYCAQGSLVTTLYGLDKRAWSEGELVEIAYDAACGVAHLHSLGIVHRDIAARNVLLAGKKDVVAKVADFGMSAEASAQSKEYAMAENGPLKWMAPEQLAKQRSSPASDVFAFGVLLFEIFARSAPWPGMNLYVAQGLVMEGKRMEIPDAVPAAAARLMTACWAHEAKDRPTMKALVAEIHQLRTNN